jgi:Homeodomain-like domain
MRSAAEVARVLALVDKGYTASQVARLTGVPRSTVRDWCAGRNLRTPRRDCRTPCGCDHEFSHLRAEGYGYLLGLYLGDGCISRSRRVWRIRIALDAAYPGIVQECASAIEAVAVGKRTYTLRRRDQRAVEVSAYWKHWPCLIPQHGPGPKHLRPIVLTEWQRRLVMPDPRPLLRGLIHSDGCRIIATERKGTYVRRAPRYAFKNRSEDILRLFGTACEAAGVHFSRASPTQIAVYSKDSVAILDRFIGPKR